jgi:hypothetical protein
MQPSHTFFVTLLRCIVKDWRFWSYLDIQFVLMEPFLFSFKNLLSMLDGQIALKSMIMPMYSNRVVSVWRNDYSYVVKVVVICLSCASLSRVRWSMHANLGCWNVSLLCQSEDMISLRKLSAQLDIPFFFWRRGVKLIIWLWNVRTT